jgi:hypothetical protein
MAKVSKQESAIAEICNDLEQEFASLDQRSSCPAQIDEEDLNALELLRRAYSAGPVSPICFDV